MHNNQLSVLKLVLLGVACTSALPSAPLATSHLRQLPAKNEPARTSELLSLRPATDTMRLKGGGLPANNVILMTCLGGALGAFSRSGLQAWTDSLTKYGPWKHILGINFFGAFLLGIVTHPSFNKDLAPMLIPACRIVSAIITVDAYGLYSKGNENESLLYLALVVPGNFCMNILGRRAAGQIL
eukprot:CAMPEP_0181323890 /NCGR_PEP_ID=MMETSP1101-20121128/20046_1 /TAXON_ID=46948 /ORGANISM="Rhodomonas abbreviata, Strain Caron Lab Isolate" /LENGTH=183 /DNA_ID=CAMNT_0023431987 /DNA_START=49 /DNA_END=600 /DNA_ORIENTATION=-